MTPMRSSKDGVSESKDSYSKCYALRLSREQRLYNLRFKQSDKTNKKINRYVCYNFKRKNSSNKKYIPKRKPDVKMIQEDSSDLLDENQLSKQSSDIFEEDSKELQDHLEKPKTLV